MKLKFAQKHLSVEDFNSIEVPDLMILTGTNGSGKSHLLQALEKRKVVLDGQESSRIVYFNYETFKLENEGAFSAQQITSERENAWAYFNQQIKNNLANFKNQIAAYYPRLESYCRTNDKSLWYLSEQEANTIDVAAYNTLQTYKRGVKDFFKQDNIKGNEQAHAIEVLAKTLPYSLDEITHDDFINLYKPFYFKSDFLPTQLGKILWDYYVRLRHNQVNEFENTKYGKTYPVLSEADFIKKYGEKPWDLINEILKKFNNLEYTVSSPEGVDVFSNYQLKLLHSKKANLSIDFENLSSGERILMALVASIYKSMSDNHFPDVLLLDEIDASLHPSMIRNLLSVIEEVFLAKGIKVILVTHSPTTVAIAPEESIYVMNRGGMDRIQKKTKEEALEILTEGFMTLEQGIKIFDQVSNAAISLISEGENVSLIRKAMELYGVTGVDLIDNIEDRSGMTQMKTLFDFFEKVPHTKKVLFVWDCDANSYRTLPETANTIPFVFAQNAGNTIAKKGIENLFDESLFTGFVTTVMPSAGASRTEFDQNRKRDFEAFIIGRNNKDDFKNFEPLFAKISSLTTPPSPLPSSAGSVT